MGVVVVALGGDRLRTSSVFFGTQWRNPEFSNRAWLFTWQQLTIVPQTLYWAVPGCVGVRPGGLLRWCNDSPVARPLSFWAGTSVWRSSSWDSPGSGPGGGESKGRCKRFRRAGLPSSRTNSGRCMPGGSVSGSLA